MGYSLYRLEIIKGRFVNSNSKELNNLFKFIGEQLDSGYDDHESKYTVFLDRKVFENIMANPSGITPSDLETLLNFVEERIDVCRISNKADKILGELEKDEFYFQEERYTELEKYILKLTLG
jgi:hypothetical protein